MTWMVFCVVGSLAGALIWYGQWRLELRRITPLEARHKLVTGQWRGSPKAVRCQSDASPMPAAAREFV